MLGKLLASGVAFRPRLTEINARLAEIGPPPKEGEPPELEPRHDGTSGADCEKAEINVALGKAEDLSVRINGLINKISMLRRDLFTDLLTKRYELTDAIGDQVISDVLAEGQTLRQRIGAAILRFAYQVQILGTDEATFSGAAGCRWLSISSASGCSAG